MMPNPNNSLHTNRRPRTGFGRRPPAFSGAGFAGSTRSRWRTGLITIMNRLPKRRILARACIRAQNLRWSALLLCLVMAFLGCSRTVTGGYDDSPDKKYRLYGRIFGAYGHNFSENTAKSLHISIVAIDNQTLPLFKKDYRVKGCSISWTSSWDKEDNLTVVLTDYGSAFGQVQGSATNHICTLSFHLDSKAGTFMEQRTGG
jgi:hypothetical protein